MAAVLHFLRACVRRPVFGLALLLWLSGLGQARAWTDTHVVGVAARLDASHLPTMRVALDVRVRVNAGRLNTLEVAGLDADATLAPDVVAVITSADGMIYLPSASTTGPGMVVLRFADRHAAPGHGDYTATLTYDTHQAFESAETLAGERKRLRWTLPSWEVGLPDVHIIVVAPQGTKAAELAASAAFGDETSLQALPTGIELTFRRVELPRTQAWEIAFDVPASARPATAAVATSQQRKAESAEAGNPGRPWTWLAGLALGLVALAKRRLTRRVCERYNLHPTPLVKLRSEQLRVLLLLASCAAGFGLFRVQALGSSVLLAFGIACALDRNLVRLPLPAASTFRVASEAELHRSRWRRLSEHFAAEAWLDTTTVVGMASLALAHAPWVLLSHHGAGRELWLCAALCVTPLFFTATRQQRPLSVAGMLAWLSQARAAAAFSAVSTELLVGSAPDGRALDARLRFSPASVVAGSGKLELCVTDALLYGRPRSALALLALSARGSPADAILAQALPGSEALLSPDGKHVARVCVTQSASEDAAKLLQWLTPAGNALARISEAA